MPPFLISSNAAEKLQEQIAFVEQNTLSFGNVISCFPRVSLLLIVTSVYARLPITLRPRSNRAANFDADVSCHH